MDALKLQDQLKLPTKALSEGIKRKVGAGFMVPLRRHRSVPDTVPLVPAVLRAEHPGKPVGGASGRAVHGDGPRGAAADVVRGASWSGPCRSLQEICDLCNFCKNCPLSCF